MEVRLASPSEAEQLWWVRNQAIRHGCRNVYDERTLTAWTPDQIPEGYPKAVASNPFFVINDKISQLVVSTGFLDLSSGSVEAIFTLPKFEGRGMASRILEAIKQEARGRGFTKLTLASTPNALAFYEKNGFTLLGESFYPSQLAQTNLRCMDMFCYL